MLRGDWRRTKTVRTVPAEVDVVVEEASSGYCGAIIGVDQTGVTLEDRFGRRRVFPLAPAGFLLDGELVTLVRPVKEKPVVSSRTASGSIAVRSATAKVARASRIYVEGVHDAELIEQVWGDDLRVEGVVVEPLHGIDDLPAIIEAFRPDSARRLGVLVDHLVAGSKESRIVEQAVRGRAGTVLVTGHPYVDIWQAVKPAALGIAQWPTVARGKDWKTGVCAALGFDDPAQGWRRIRAAVRDYTDLETPLLGAVEELIDFVTAN